MFCLCLCALNYTKYWLMLMVMNQSKLDTLVNGVLLPFRLFVIYCDNLCITPPSPCPLSRPWPNDPHPCAAHHRPLEERLPLAVWLCASAKVFLSYFSFWVSSFSSASLIERPQFEQFLEETLSLFHGCFKNPVQSIRLIQSWETWLWSVDWQ